MYAAGDKHSSGIVVSKLFESSDEETNSDAAMLGFGSGKLKKLSVGENFRVFEPPSFDDLIGESPTFINYQAETTTGNCEMVEWVISVETGTIGEEQLKEFKKDPKNKIKARTPLGSLRITQNFDEDVYLEVKPRVKDIKKLSHVKIYPTKAEMAKKKALLALKKKAEAIRKQKAEKARQDHLKLVRAIKRKRKIEKAKRRKLAKLLSELKKKKAAEAKKNRLAKLRRLKAKKLKTLKHKLKLKKKLIKRLPKSLHHIFQTRNIRTKKMLVNIP